MNNAQQFHYLSSHPHGWCARVEFHCAAVRCDDALLQYQIDDEDDIV
jgi:hypothetical protein